MKTLIAGTATLIVIAYFVLSSLIARPGTPDDTIYRIVLSGPTAEEREANYLDNEIDRAEAQRNDYLAEQAARDEQQYLDSEY